MIDLFYWPTPNGWKVTIMLAECGLAYRTIPINISKGEQFEGDFTAVSPNNRIPAIIDHCPPDGGTPLSVFESGAILIYLAEKTGRFLPAQPRSRKIVLEWLMWQVGGLGPMAGQNGHFLLYASQRIPYAIQRYSDEVRRLYRVLDKHLARTQSFVADEYSIADIAIFPWIVTHRAQGLDLSEYPHIAVWFSRMRERPAVSEGMNVLRELRTLKRNANDAKRANTIGDG